MPGTCIAEWRLTGDGWKLTIATPGYFGQNIPAEGACQIASYLTDTPGLDLHPGDEYLTALGWAPLQSIPWIMAGTTSYRPVVAITPAISPW